MRSALSDLPQAEVDELIEDTEDHVRELAREHGEDQLELRLGSPEAYAAELRSAAGYPPPPGPEQEQPTKPEQQRNDGVEVLGLAGLVVTTASALLVGASIRSYHTTALFLLTGLVGLAISLPLLVRPGGMKAVAELPTIKALTPFLTPDESTVTGKVLAYVYSLQPAWWLLRVTPFVLLTHGGLIALVILGVPAAVVSILVGHYSRRDPRMLWLVVPANALVAAVLLTYFIGF